MAEYGRRINLKKDQNQKYRPMHLGVRAQYLHLEKFVHTWFLNQYKVEFFASTSDIIAKALQIAPNFKDEPLVFHYSIPKLTGLLLLHSKPHD